MRLHTDQGEVLTIDPALWVITPEVGLAERSRRRRLIHCPDGRLIYRHDDLFSEQLATKTMLRLARRRPAEGQQPIASYPTSRGYAPLYAVADSVPLAPLPPAVQAAFELNRTCAICLVRGVRPWPKGRNGERACHDCAEQQQEER
ncbi:hypothetical protein ACIBEJ_00400 [Nonomuraea sp. NPDC050790]|uniref:hypothetical protein n=1 Tax=Nonomuraea sp. NPDC050790 TaxID=3364371 RepID=UPI00379379A0